MLARGVDCAPEWADDGPGVSAARSAHALHAGALPSVADADGDDGLVGLRSVVAGVSMACSETLTHPLLVYLGALQKRFVKILVIAANSVLHVQFSLNLMSTMMPRRALLDPC